MRFVSRLMALPLMAFVVFGMVACGGATSITLGTYNETSQTFTAGAGLASLTQSGNELTLSGTIPYSAGTLGLTAGNIVAIRIAPAQKFEPDDGTSVKTTNAQSADLWNTYGQEAIEDDGSVIWVAAVTKDKTLEIKIKWNSSQPEVTYILKVDPDATLATE